MSSWQIARRCKQHVRYNSQPQYSVCNSAAAPQQHGTSPLPASSLQLARSVLFNALFYLNLTVHMIVALPTLAMPYPVLRAFIRSYARTSLWLLRVVAGTKVAWRGLENIPDGACILACKHQSVWETFALFAVLRDPTYILKRELMWIPLFGWYMRRARLIPIDRSAGMAALSRMTVLARQELARARQLLLFPEGTRRPAWCTYTPGLACLACRSRSIPGCSGRAARCAACPARSWSKRSRRSRPASKAAHSSRSCKSASRQQPRAWWPKANANAPRIIGPSAAAVRRARLRAAH
jgi:1-acyl-sn-glycerol-3-phosphate acyltransferase